ncbi:ATP-depentend DNA helicase-like protein [Cryomyces antarcticus]
MDAILDGLNEAQKSAVTSPASVLQVLAPPGSGKTKTLTSRVAYLISHQHLSPWNIVVCTFTIKAAREMKERIRALVGDGLESKLVLGTFHSVARRYLHSYGHHIGIDKNFGIADSSDTLAIIKRIIKRHHLNLEPSVVRSRISGFKARSTNCEEYAATSKKAEQHEFAIAYAEYEAVLKASNLLDYDDLLLRCVSLLRTHPECVSNVEAVLIDEFQDTNTVQFDLMCLIAQRRHTITIVGDPDQSIYGFRSAEIKNLARMQEKYPGTLVIVLEENYRSSAAILLTAMEIIEQDESRPAKKLLPTHCAGERPVLRKLPSAAIEAEWLVGEIKRSQRLTGNLFTFSDFAILLRSASLSRHLESALGKAGIPYRMVGGHRFFDRMEVKIILDYLRVINQPEHNDALVRIINVPSRKIGEGTIRALLEEAEQKNVSLWNLILNTAQGNDRPTTKLSPQACKGLESFVNLVFTSRMKLLNAEETPLSLIDLVSHILRKLSFREFLWKAYTEDFDTRWANVEELIAQANDMSAALARGGEVVDDVLPNIDGIEQRQLSSSEDTLSRFLANVALSTEVQRADAEGQTEQVTISTIHAAKGLEWPVVFIPATYEGSIPHSRAEDTDEERRLLYVGMTRAQSLLYLSCPRRNSQREQTTLSQFLSSKSTSKNFEPQGPSFRFTTTQDLARILRRPCPADALIEAGRKSIDRHEDDYWPLDGEELSIDRSKWNYSNSSDALLPPDELAYKRRRIVDRSGGLQNGSTNGAPISITTLDQQNYSVSSTTLSSGFVSAGVRMKELEGRQASNAAVAAHKADQARKTKLSLAGMTSTKRSTNQGNLHTFFSRQSSGTSKCDASSLKVNGFDPEHAAKSDDLPVVSARFAGPLEDISNVAPVQNESALPSLPSAAAAYKPRSARMVGRPCGLMPDHNVRTKDYVFLSSSPVKPEDDVDSTASASLVSPVKNSSIGKEDMRPATTCHTTSLAGTNAQSTPQRRTLGTRRSLHGWSARWSKP